MVSRYGAEASGDLPARARVMAEGLAARGHAVTVLTTTALDPVTFESVLPEGGREAEAAGATGVVRFATRGGAGRKTGGSRPLGSDRHQVPLVPDLVTHLRDGWSNGALLCFDATSWTTQRAIEMTAGRSALVPACSLGTALQDAEVAASFRAAATVLFDTLEEQDLASRRLGLLRGEVIGEVIGHAFAVGPGSEVGSSGPGGLSTLRDGSGALLSSSLGLGRYVVYAGRLEATDGCAVLVEQFLRYQRAVRSPLSLVLLGRGRVELHESAHVRLLGDLAEAERRRVIAGALAVLVPTRREALAPLCLEAWRESRPVLATGPSAVMRGVVERIGGGLACRGFDELSGALDLLEGDSSLAETLGRSGRRALEQEHALPLVLDRCELALRRLQEGRAAA